MNQPYDLGTVIETNEKAKYHIVEIKSVEKFEITLHNLDDETDRQIIHCWELDELVEEHDWGIISAPNPY